MATEQELDQLIDNYGEQGGILERGGDVQFFGADPDNLSLFEYADALNIPQEEMEDYAERLKNLDQETRGQVISMSENIARAAAQDASFMPGSNNGGQQDAFRELMSEETIERLSHITSSPALTAAVQTRLEEAISNDRTISGDDIPGVVSEAFQDLSTEQQLDVAEQLMPEQSALFDQLREEMPGNQQLAENTGQLLDIMAGRLIQDGAGGGSEALLNMAGDNPEQAVRILSSNGASGALERFEHSMTQHEEALAEYDEARQAYEQEVTEYEAAGGADSDLEAPVEPTAPEAPTLQDSVAQEAASHAMLAGGVSAIGTAGLIGQSGNLISNVDADRIANLAQQATSFVSGQNGGRLEFGPFSVGPGVMMAMTNNSAYGMSCLPAVAGHFGMEFGGARGEVLAACDAANAEYYREFVSGIDGLDPSNISPDGYDNQGNLEYARNDDDELMVRDSNGNMSHEAFTNLDPASKQSVEDRANGTAEQQGPVQQIADATGITIPQGVI